MSGRSDMDTTSSRLTIHKELKLRDVLLSSPAIEAASNFLAVELGILRRLSESSRSLCTSKLFVWVANIREHSIYCAIHPARRRRWMVGPLTLASTSSCRTGLADQIKSACRELVKAVWNDWGIVVATDRAVAESREEGAGPWLPASSCPLAGGPTSGLLPLALSFQEEMYARLACPPLSLPVAAAALPAEGSKIKGQAPVERGTVHTASWPSSNQVGSPPADLEPRPRDGGSKAKIVLQMRVFYRRLSPSGTSEAGARSKSSLSGAATVAPRRRERGAAVGAGSEAVSPPGSPATPLSMGWYFAAGPRETPPVVSSALSTYGASGRKDAAAPGRGADAQPGYQGLAVEVSLQIPPVVLSGDKTSASVTNAERVAASGAGGPLQMAEAASPRPGGLIGGLSCSMFELREGIPGEGTGCATVAEGREESTRGTAGLRGVQGDAKGEEVPSGRATPRAGDSETPGRRHGRSLWVLVPRCPELAVGGEPTAGSGSSATFASEAGTPLHAPSLAAYASAKGQMSVWLAWFEHQVWVDTSHRQRGVRKEAEEAGCGAGTGPAEPARGGGAMAGGALAGESPPSLGPGPSREADTAPEISESDAAAKAPMVVSKPALKQLQSGAANADRLMDAECLGIVCERRVERDRDTGKENVVFVAVACAALSGVGGDVCRVGMVFVPPAGRGRGLGRAATAAAMELGRCPRRCRTAVILADWAYPTTTHLYGTMGEALGDDLPYAVVA